MDSDNDSYIIAKVNFIIQTKKTYFTETSNAHARCETASVKSQHK